MEKHVFLTGEKGVGKSTLIRRILEQGKRSYGGFFTVRTDKVYGGRYSVHLIEAGRGDGPSEENLLFFCDVPDEINREEQFNTLGCKALQNAAGAGLIIMDELGTHEVNAAEFCSAVMRILDGDVPVLGVLQKADSPFLEKVANHPKVQLIEVTKENRNGLLKELIHTCGFSNLD